MATFNFTSPDGQSYTVNGPDDATQEQAFAILQQQLSAGTAQSTSVPDEATLTAQNIDSQLQAAQSDLKSAADDGSLGAPTGPDERGAWQKFKDRNAAVWDGSSSFDYAGQYKELRNKNRNPDEEELFQARKSQIDEYLPQARQLKKSNPEAYPQDEIDLAGALARGDDAKTLAQIAVTGLTLPVAPGAGLAARTAIGAGLGLGTTAAGQVADQVASGKTASDTYNPTELAYGTAGGGVGGAAAPAIGKGVSYVGSKIGNLLSDAGVNLPSLGISKDAANLRRYATSTNNDTLDALTQRGVQDASERANAQELVRTGLSDDSGKTLLTPAQTFNDTTSTGRRFTGAQARDTASGGAAFGSRIAEQESGAPLRRALDLANANPEAPAANVAGTIPTGSGRGVLGGTPTGVDGITADGDTLIQSGARAIGDEFKQSASQLYKQGADNAQKILDDANVKSLKLPQTKQLAAQHLSDDADAGRVNLTAETRRTLNSFQNANLKDIPTVDKWKRTLSEKAAKAGRNGDYESQNALRSTLDSLRNEADSTLQSISPTASSLYRDADAFYSDSVGDVGSKSVFGKIANDANPQTAENKIFTPSTGKFNLENLSEGVNNSINRTAGTASGQGIADAAVDLGRGIGVATRDRAFDAATRNGDFNPTVLRNTLGRYGTQAEGADAIADAGYKANRTTPMITQAGSNEAIRDSAGVTSRVSDARDVPVTAGSTARDVLLGAGLGLTHGPVGSVIGAVGGLVKQSAVARGFLDSLRGTNRKASQYADWLTSGNNADKVQDYLAVKNYLKNNKGSKVSDKLASDEAARISAQRARETQAPHGNFNQSDIDTYNAARQLWDNVSPEDVEKMARDSVPAIRKFIDSSIDAGSILAGAAGAESGRSIADSPTPDGVQVSNQGQVLPQTPSTEEAARRAEVESRTLNRANEESPDGAMISPRNEAIYRGIVNAETGGLKDPWIRTKAKDPSSQYESTAYGPAQLTGSLVNDMLNRYPDIFTPEEKQYAQYFVQQAAVMNANPNDPTYGYGKSGVLGKTNKMKGLYNGMARKILNQLSEENGGDYEKVLQRWRGVNDPAYFSKVDQGVNNYINDYNNKQQG